VPFHPPGYAQNTEAHPRSKLVEFLQARDTLDALRNLGVQSNPSDEGQDASITLVLDHEDRRTAAFGPSAATSIHAVDAALDPHTSLSEAAESVLGLVHVNESIVIPSTRWRNILDIAAFALAKHERWLDIDSGATLNQNARDPLAVLPDDKHLVGAIIAAAVEHGENDSTNIYVTTLDTPLLIEARHDGVLLVHCAPAPIMDNILQGFTKS